MADGLIESVSDTAFWVAYYRAVETRRPDALFQDPLASVLAGEQGKKIAEEMPMRFMTSWVIAIRTCIIDEYIRMAIADGVEAVVNLGAGLDTRPYRMDLCKSFLWIEADYPRMIEYKESRLRHETPRCTLQRVPVDLANPAERRKLLADVDARGKKLLTLTEGVIPYLSVEEVGALADDLKAISHVRYWITEYLSPDAIKFRERGGISRKTKNAPFKFKPADWFGFFRERGWAVKEMRYFNEEGKRLKRPLKAPLLLKVIMKVRTLLASEEKREALKKVAGYALLEPAKTSGTR
jgi:methyltransferase (TIGR00027 family)